MLKWHEATTFNGIAIEHIPLFDDDEFQLVINYMKGYESVSGWVPGYFFVGVSCKTPRYGNLFIRKSDHVETAEEAEKRVFEFTGFSYASAKELQKIIDTNGALNDD